MLAIPVVVVPEVFQKIVHSRNYVKKGIQNRTTGSWFFEFNV